MSEVLESLSTEYQQKLLLEKEALKNAEAAKAAAIRNIDRIEGALFGLKDAQAKILATVSPDVQAETQQEDIEVQD